VAAQGVELGCVRSPRLGEGAVGAAVLRGEPYWREDCDGRHAPDEAGDHPLVVIPLCAGPRPVGAIAVHRLLRHKSGFSRLDRELLALLGGQAATALLAARSAGDSTGRWRGAAPAAVADGVGR
jgi:GAF domain-containing protein